MRTKVLLCAVAMAASLASSMAQNVYSINVVGYVNTTMAGIASGPSYTAFANPLDGTMGGTVTGGNNLTNYFPVVPIGSAIFQYISSSAQFGNAASFNATKSGGAWNTTFDLPPGTGFMFHNAATTNVPITFVGQVQQGTAFPVKNLGANQYTLIGAPVPIGGDLTNSLTGLTPNVGDAILTFQPASSQWGAGASFNATKSGGSWSPNIQVAPAVGLLYHNSGAAINWTANFTVQ